MRGEINSHLIDCPCSLMHFAGLEEIRKAVFFFFLRRDMLTFLKTRYSKTNFFFQVSLSKKKKKTIDGKKKSEHEMEKSPYIYLKFSLDLIKEEEIVVMMQAKTEVIHLDLLPCFLLPLPTFFLKQSIEMNKKILWMMN